MDQVTQEEAVSRLLCDLAQQAQREADRLGQAAAGLPTWTAEWHAAADAEEAAAALTAMWDRAAFVAQGHALRRWAELG